MNMRACRSAQAYEEWKKADAEARAMEGKLAVTWETICRHGRAAQRRFDSGSNGQAWMHRPDEGDA
jgi:hypothetical protein